jgi:hypothetical protein
MTESNWLAQSFEQNRTCLRAVAYRMLGSLGPDRLLPLNLAVLD